MELNEIEKLAISEKAHKEYLLGKSYKEISEKYDVPINTLKSWKRRYKWTRDCTLKKGCNKKELQELGNNLYKEIKEDLLLQLSINETEEKRYIDLVDDYMSLWDIKNRLIQDIRERGVTVLWENGKQTGYKKNDSVSELVKVNTQMLKILNDLNLKPSPKVDDEDDL
nr:MAG TPA: terminase small subunit [Caudoviricetes sp.]